jgi:hypothetical protein
MIKTESFITLTRQTLANEVNTLNDAINYYRASMTVGLVYSNYERKQRAYNRIQVLRRRKAKIEDCIRMLKVMSKV